MLVNVSLGLALAGALATPILAYAGYSSVALDLHQMYLFLCPQRPSHSYFLLGHQLALEEREIAMFTAQLVGGLVYGKLRARLRIEVNSIVFVALSLPLAWDVLSQTLAVRSSDWFTRSWTGAIFMVAFAFWFYPRLERERPGAHSSVA